jgi:16S rRNA (adenine1518-N6/adenine1519-N6)-dimethyltransferase
VSQIDNLPPLRDVIETHGLLAKKSLGQNFLLDLNLTLKIAKSSGSLAGYTVLEIGPGPGGLTRALLAAGADRVVAIERDSRCISALNEIAAHYPGRLEIIEADALAFDPKPLLAGCKTKIMANLPYNIGTELLTGWLTTPNWPPFFDSMTLMFQREVAERIIATPQNRKNYGRLGVLCGWRTDAKILFNVPPSAFTPPPTIMSSIVQLTPFAQPHPCDVKILERVTAAAFGQRRKMLRQSLKSLGTVDDILLSTGIEGTQRAEELSVEAFIDLANAVHASLNNPRT